MITQLQQVEQTIFITGYRLVFCDSEVFKTWRCFRAHLLLGLLFEHSTHWSNGVDRIRYADPRANASKVYLVTTEIENQRKNQHLSFDSLSKPLSDRLNYCQ